MCFVSILSPVFLIKKKAIDFYSCSYRKLGENWKIVNSIRSKILRKMVGEDKPLSIDSKVDFARLPPCRDSLLPQIQRVNYRVSRYKKVHIPIFERLKPYDEDQGWVCGETNIIEPLWTKGGILLQSVIDLMGTDDNDEEDADDEIELEVSSDYEADDDVMED